MQTCKHLFSSPLPPQGRFSGRLQHKSDEVGLAEECRTLALLLGGSTDPDDAGREPALDSLSSIVRAIAAGNVRRFLQAREDERQVGTEGFGDSCLQVCICSVKATVFCRDGGVTVPEAACQAPAACFRGGRGP